MSSLDRFAAAKLAALDAQALQRRPVDTGRAAFPAVERGGRRLVSFSCNDYLGLSVDPRVKAAAAAALECYGVGAGASRLVTGNHPLYPALETRLAAMKGTAAACVFGSGYLANIGVLGALAGEGDIVVLDALSHACLHAGARLAGARAMTFRHNDAAHADALLRELRPSHRRALLVTETVFSMDGDRAPLGALRQVAARHDAWLMTDDAHGFGVGAPDAAGNGAAHDGDGGELRMGTLSKAVGGYGGYCCASAPVVALLASRARPLVYSTGLPPATVAAACAALDIIAAEPALVAAPLAKARLFTDLVGLPPAQSAVVPLVLGAPEAALAASRALAEAGFLIAAIRPPTVPPGTARLRFAFSARHADSDVQRLAAAVRTLAAPSRPMPCPASS